jgi:FdhE protein
MGRYGQESGQRFLWCFLCDLQWVFPRVACPFCGCTDPAQLGSLRPEGVEHHRVDVCDSCWGYLRAVDERARPAPADLLREEVATTYLCAIAEQRGYRQGRFNGLTAATSPTSIVEETH